MYAIRSYYGQFRLLGQDLVDDELQRFVMSGSGSQFGGT